MLTIEEVRPDTGTCKFCGQIFALTLSDEEWAEHLEKTGLSGETLGDEIATLRCKCKEGAKYRMRSESLFACSEIIEGTFRNEFPDIADLLQSVKGTVYGGHTVSKIVATLPGDKGQATISYGKDGMKVEYKKVLLTGASTGF